MANISHCPFCGSKLEYEKAAFCPSCGKKIIVEQQRQRRWLPLLVAVCALVVVGIGAWIEHATAHPATPVATSAPVSETAALKPAPSAPDSLQQSVPAKEPASLTAGEIFKKASPSVVRIFVSDADGKPYAMGSGFVVGSTGQIATNYHVIRGANRASARFPSGTEVDVTGVLAVDRQHDLALLQTSEPYATPLSLNQKGETHEGDKVFVIGSPLNLQNTFSEGIVSSIRRGGLIQMTAPISHGSSGGPVFDESGSIVGISTLAAPGNLGENLNFAVPVSFLKPYLQNHQVRLLSDVTAQAAVSQEVFRGYFALDPHDRKVIPVQVDADKMSQAVLSGNYRSHGGLGGEVHLVLTRNGAIYRNFGDGTGATLNEKLTPGNYALVFFSDRAVLASRDVDAQFTLHFSQ